MTIGAIDPKLKEQIDNFQNSIDDIIKADILTPNGIKAVYRQKAELVEKI